MGMSVSTAMGFENQEYVKNSAKNTTQSNEAAVEKGSESIMQKPATYVNTNTLSAQQYVLLASTQITLNNSLKETLNYLRQHANDKKKEYMLGDLWKVLNAENESSEKNPYKGELLDIVIDYNEKNIFAA